MLLIRLLLLPFGLLYSLIMQFRRAMYELTILKRYSPTFPTIVIGNLNAGGSGKTPHLIWIAQLLLKKGFKTNVLSRGYGRETSGFLEVKDRSTASECGDEPLLIRNKLPESKVFVCENRPEGLKIIAKDSLHPVLLDDAFQHLSLKAGYYILLTTFQFPFYLDFPLPAGRLREWRGAAKSADLILVTKCPEMTGEEDQKFVKNQIRKYSQAEVFFTGYKQELPQNQFNNKYLPANTDTILLITGIANSKGLKSFLVNQYPGSKIKHMNFHDHHEYEDTTIEQIQIDAEKTNAKIVTTEKDWVKIREFPMTEENEKLWYVASVSVYCDKNTEDKLVSTIQNFLINFATA